MSNEERSIEIASLCEQLRNEEAAVLKYEALLLKEREFREFLRTLGPFSEYVVEQPIKPSAWLFMMPGLLEVTKNAIDELRLRIEQLQSEQLACSVEFATAGQA